MKRNPMALLGVMAALAAAAGPAPAFDPEETEAWKKRGARKGRNARMKSFVEKRLAWENEGKRAHAARKKLDLEVERSCDLARRTIGVVTERGGKSTATRRALRKLEALRRRGARARAIERQARRTVGRARVDRWYVEGL